MLNESRIKYVPLVLLVLGILKGFFINPSWSEVALLGILAVSACFYQFFSDEKRFKLLHTRMDEVDKHLSSLYKSDEEIKNHISGIKVSQNLRTTNIFGSTK